MESFKVRALLYCLSPSLWKCNEEAKTNSEPQNRLLFAVSAEGERRAAIDFWTSGLRLRGHAKTAYTVV